MANPVHELREHGQSVWLDYIRRSLVASDELDRMIRDVGLRGMTSNPTIFSQAITGSSDYDDQIAELARAGVDSPYDAFIALAVRDIRAAADAFRAVYDESDGEDGYVSLEAPPGIEHDAERTVEEVRRLFRAVDRPNVMIKVPGTDAGVAAVERLIAEGINVNITLLFAVEQYERVIDAYQRGLERRVDAGESVRRIGSVASFFVSRIDTKVDPMLPEGSGLRGQVAVANARLAYGRFRERFDGPRWKRLADAGARVQRPLWASTGTKNRAYSDVLYVEELVAPHTVNTVPEKTLRAFLDHGRVRDAIAGDSEEPRRILAAAAGAGIDLGAITAELLDEGLASFASDFQELLSRLDEQLDECRRARGTHPPRFGGDLGSLAGAVDSRIAALREGRVVRRIWDGDHAVWKPDPTEIVDRLGWLTVADEMLEEADALRDFASKVAAEGYRRAVLLGMGGSSLAPEVLRATFDVGEGMLDLDVLDTTDPEQIATVEREIDIDRTLFIVASKSGTTIETLSHLAYFWEKAPNGDQFVAITDPGSSLEAIGRERRFRRVFANPPDIGGRYSALSYFGLVPAALIGVDIRSLLGSAQEMAQACHPCVPVEANPGAWLGAVMGDAARAGRDKLTLLLPAQLATLGYWIEQLVAESTGKEGRGIVPVEGEPVGPPEAYGRDRLFVAVGEHEGIDALVRSGHPVVRLPFHGAGPLGGEFLRWEFATAVAGHVLGIQPFDQPNVQEAKDATNRILAGERPKVEEGTMQEAIEALRPGDYFAILAYLPRTAAVDERLQRLRLRVRDEYRVATTVGYGPRFLHSTGQLHKGGADNGVFLQIVREVDPGDDRAVPGKDYTFGQLQAAQALGDYESLRARGRRVVRVRAEALAEVTT